MWSSCHTRFFSTDKTSQGKRLKLHSSPETDIWAPGVIATLFFFKKITPPVGCLIENHVNKPYMWYILSIGKIQIHWKSKGEHWIFFFNVWMYFLKIFSKQHCYLATGKDLCNLVWACPSMRKELGEIKFKKEKHNYSWNGKSLKRKFFDKSLWKVLLSRCLMWQMPNVCQLPG